MFCTHCGKPIEAGARFCPACGGATQPSAGPMGAGAASGLGSVFTAVTGQLNRPRSPRAIAGVCSGLALHFGWDVTLVRLLWVLCVLFAGTGVIAYLVAWVVIPEGPYELPQPGNGVSI